MTAPKQVDFIDGTTIVAAEFLDRIQEIQAGLAVNAALAISGTNIVLNAGTGNDVCSMTIDERFRYIESPQVVSFSGSDSTGSYSIWATTSDDDSSPGFTLVKTSGTTTPTADNYRRIGSVSWNSSTSSLSNLVQLAGYSDHGYMHSLAEDPLPTGSVSSAQIVDGTITLADLSSAVQALLVPAGTISAFGGSSAPGGWLLCDGSSYSPQTYPNLFSAIGTNYGGTSEAPLLPNLVGRVPYGYSASVTELNSLNKNDGLSAASRGPNHAHNHTLTLPNHTHSVNIAVLSGDHGHSFGLGVNAHSHGGVTGGANDVKVGAFAAGTLAYAAHPTAHQHGIAAEAPGVGGWIGGGAHWCGVYRDTAGNGFTGTNNPTSNPTVNGSVQSTTTAYAVVNYIIKG